MGDSLTHNVKTHSVQKWHVEFSSALENKTGKYFIGRDIIDSKQGFDKVRPLLATRNRR